MRNRSSFVNDKKSFLFLMSHSHKMLKEVHVLVTIALLLSFTSSKGWPVISSPPSSPKDIVSLTFLVCVNDTWGSCMTTVRTPPIKPDTPWNKSENIIVGDCDHGALLYTVAQSEGDRSSDLTVDVTFYSHVIEDASHPECRITWDFQYLVPKTGDSSSSLLPGCFVADSREGYHMTYYWFYILEWS